MESAFEKTISESLRESIQIKESLFGLLPEIARAGQLLVDSLKAGGRIYFLGNGGSAADAQHLATELVGRFERDNCLPAMALTTDSSALTALANDYSFDEVFSRQVMALARPGDTVVAISTSGNSPNVLEAARAGRQRGTHVVGMSGGDGGKLKSLCDVCLVVPSKRVCRVQEAHITMGHILCELVEASLPSGVTAPCA